MFDSYIRDHARLSPRAQAVITPRVRATYARFKDAAVGQGHVAYSFEEEQQYDKAVELYRKLAIGDPKTSPKWLAAAPEISVNVFLVSGSAS